MSDKKAKTFDVINEEETIDKHGNIYSDPDITSSKLLLNNTIFLDKNDSKNIKSNEKIGDCVFCDGESYDEIDYIEDRMGSELRKQAIDMGINLRNRYDKPECNRCLNRHSKNNCKKFDDSYVSDYNLEDVLKYIMADDLEDEDKIKFTALDDVTIVNGDGIKVDDHKQSSTSNLKIGDNGINLDHGLPLNDNVLVSSINKEKSPNMCDSEKSIMDNPKEDIVEVKISPRTENPDKPINSETFILSKSDFKKETLINLEDDQHFMITTTCLNMNNTGESLQEIELIKDELNMNLPRITESIDKLIDDVNKDIDDSKGNDHANLNIDKSGPELLFLNSSLNIPGINDKNLQNISESANDGSIQSICKLFNIENSSSCNEFSSCISLKETSKDPDSIFYSKSDHHNSLSILKKDDENSLNLRNETIIKNESQNLYKDKKPVDEAVSTKLCNTETMNLHCTEMTDEKLEKENHESIFKVPMNVNSLLEKHKKNLKINTYVMKDEAIKIKNHAFKNDQLLSCEKSSIQEKLNERNKTKNTKITKIIFGDGSQGEEAQEIMLEAEKRIKLNCSETIFNNNSPLMQRNRVRRHIFRHYEKKSFIEDVVSFNDLKLDTIFGKFLKKGKSGTWQNNWFQLKGTELTCFNGKHKKIKEIGQFINESYGEIKLSHDDDYYLTKKYSFNLNDAKMFIVKNSDKRVNCLGKLVNKLRVFKKEEDFIDFDMIKILKIEEYCKEFKICFYDENSKNQNYIVIPFLEICLEISGRRDTKYFYRFKDISIFLKWLISMNLRTGRISWPIP